LKEIHQKEHEQKLQNWAKEHHGNDKQGKAGKRVGKNKTPGMQGDLK
jgi:hypothetical protein